MEYRRAPFLEGYKFCEWSKKEVRGNYFHKMTLGAFFAVHVNLQEMEFSVKQISWKSRKSTKSMKFTAIEKRAPYGSCHSAKSQAPAVIHSLCNYCTIYGFSIKHQLLYFAQGNLWIA